MKKTIRCDAQTTLYHENFECTRALLDDHRLYAYFRKNEEFAADVASGEAGNDDERQLHCKALELSELFASHFEHVTLQIDTPNALPQELAATWVAYMKDVHAMSPVLRKFLVDRHRWYSPALRAKLGIKVPGYPEK